LLVQMLRRWGLLFTCLKDLPYHGGRTFRLHIPWLRWPVICSSKDSALCVYPWSDGTKEEGVP
jgi:hypothetical protein